MESSGFELNKEIGFCMKILFDEDDESLNNLYVDSDFSQIKNPQLPP